MWRDGRLPDYLPTWADVRWWLEEGRPTAAKLDVLHTHAHTIIRR